MDQPIDAPDLPEDMFSPEQTSFRQKLFRDIFTTMREKEAYYKQLLDSHVALQQEFAEFKSAVSAATEDEEREVTALSVPPKAQKAPSEREPLKVKAPSEQNSQHKPPRAVLKIVDVPKPQVEAMENDDDHKIQISQSEGLPKSWMEGPVLIQAADDVDDSDDSEASDVESVPEDVWGAVVGNFQNFNFQEGVGISCRLEK
ncbi:hypothetical protein FQA39_LY18354 [Lamprigera yunnana]|nr:hypothetical protein FQA39_LY18354 [Lamprigera yunnana]